MNSGRRKRRGWAAHARRTQIRSCRPESLDPRQHVVACFLPVVEECLGLQIPTRYEFAIDVEDPARMDIIEQNMPTAFAAGDLNAIAHVGAADVLGVAAVDVKNVESKLGAA